MKTSELEFGWKALDIEATAAWGARLILEDARDLDYRQVALLGDRQALKADSEEAKTVLVKALDGDNRDGAIRALLDLLTREFRRCRINADERTTFDRTLKGVRFRGSPNGSCGYFYVTGTIENVPTCNGCGTGADTDTISGSKTYPGFCRVCREERTAAKRRLAKAVRR